MTRAVFEDLIESLDGAVQIDRVQLGLTRVPHVYVLLPSGEEYDLTRPTFKSAFRTIVNDLKERNL